MRLTSQQVVCRPSRSSGLHLLHRTTEGVYRNIQVSTTQHEGQKGVRGEAWTTLWDTVGVGEKIIFTKQNYNNPAYRY